MSEKIRCPYCGANLTTADKKCEYCGCNNPYYDPKDYYAQQTVEEDMAEERLRRDPKYAQLLQEYEECRKRLKVPAFINLIIAGILLTFMLPISLVMINTMNEFGGASVKMIVAPVVMVIMAGVLIVSFFVKLGMNRRDRERMKEIEEILRNANISIY